MMMIFFFFFNDTPTTEIYTLSLPDALPICFSGGGELVRARSLHRIAENHPPRSQVPDPAADPNHIIIDRKSTRLNSSHSQISYAVFCLKKKTPMPFALLPPALHQPVTPLPA